MTGTAHPALRILCVTNMFPGPEAPDLGVFVRDMCGALADRGHRVDVVGITTRSRGRVRTPAKYLSLAARTLPRVRRADVLYAHGLLPAGTVAGLWGRALHRPWVVTAHGQDVANLRIGPVRAASLPAVRGAAGLVAVSGWLRDEIRRSGLPMPRTEVIDMGVDLDRFTPGERAAARTALGLPPEGPVVLAAGSLIPRKDPLALVRAVASARAAVPGLRLALIGDGPLRAAVRAAADTSGLGHAVHLAGVVPHADVPVWMRACDVLAVASRVEPLGQVALEALACGRPVVATAHGGTAEVVTPGVGRVVDPGDTPALAAAIADLVVDPPAPDTCRRVAAGHALAVQAARVEALLAAAAATRAGGGPPAHAAPADR